MSDFGIYFSVSEYQQLTIIRGILCEYQSKGDAWYKSRWIFISHYMNIDQRWIFILSWAMKIFLFGQKIQYLDLCLKLDASVWPSINLTGIFRIAQTSIWAGGIVPYWYAKKNRRRRRASDAHSLKTFYSIKL